jgi:hypothetical protein
LSEDYAEVRLKSRDLTPESAPFLPIPLTWNKFRPHMEKNEMFGFPCQRSLIHT